ncbi:MAG TPA: hypothetical protein VHC71_09230 [Hyphomicrobium sp.]|nr:hypothetical protein [Hyphomicrobium sp.]
MVSGKRMYRSLLIVASVSLLHFPSGACADVFASKARAYSDQSISHIVNYFGHPDPRRTIKQYALEKGLTRTQVERQFSATGKFTCPGAESGTAQIVGRRDLIVTVGHLFYDQDCRPSDWRQCYFETVFQKRVRVKIKTSTARIPRCLSNDPNSEDDWAILELQRPIPFITPYFIPPEPVTFTAGDRITEVSAQSDNFPHKAPNIGECSIRYVALPNYPKIPYVTDCSNGNGSSGSGQLVRREPGWELKAVDVFDNTFCHDGVDYDLRKSCFTASAPVSGAFFDALTEMANQR